MILDNTPVLELLKRAGVPMKQTPAVAPAPPAKRADTPPLRMRGNPTFEQDGVNGMRLIGACQRCQDRGDGTLCDACCQRLNARFA